MDTTSIFIVLGGLAFFAFVVYLAIKTGQSDTENKRQLAQALGFTPIEPDERLSLKIGNLYQHKSGNKKYQLRHVSRRIIPEGEMYLFDLIETSGEDDSFTENQAVAIISPHLDLPRFSLYPKADAEKYMLGGLANSLIRWAMTFIGTPVDFSEYPELQKKYIVSSLDPEPVRRYFDPTLAHALAQTSMANLHAGGGLFTYSLFPTGYKKLDQELLSQRINQALDLFRILSK